MKTLSPTFMMALLMQFCWAQQAKIENPSNKNSHDADWKPFYDRPRRLAGRITVWSSQGRCSSQASTQFRHTFIKVSENQYRYYNEELKPDGAWLRIDEHVGKRVSP